MPTIQRLASTHELRAAAPCPVFVRTEVPTGPEGLGPEVCAWAHEGALAFLRRGRYASIACIGPPRAAADLLVAVLPTPPTPPSPPTLPQRLGGFTLPRDAHLLLPPEIPVGPVEHWDFLWSDVAPPPVPGEERVRWLGRPAGDLARDADNVRSLLRRASPRH
ncbi:MAG: hypothetical protein ACRDPK_16225, partial [Carbonactinosporaceae bacterium]